MGNLSNKIGNFLSKSSSIIYFDEMDHQKIKDILEKGKEPDAFFVRYEDSEKENFDCFHEHVGGQGNFKNPTLLQQDISITVATKDGWIQLRCKYFTTKQLLDELQKGSFDRMNNFKYMKIPSFQLLQKGITCHSSVLSSSHGANSSFGEHYNRSHLDMGNSGFAILDFTWKEELNRYKRIFMVPVSCPDEICDAIRSYLPSPAFVGEDADVTVVVTRKTTRVQSDAERAMQYANITQANQKPVILMMFEAVAGNKTIEDVKATFYSSPLATKTYHVPYKKS